MLIESKASAPGFAALWSGAQSLPILLRVNGEIGQSWLDFVQMRFKKDADLFQRLISIGTPADVGAIYMKYWQETAADYSGEFREIGNIVWSASAGTAGPTRR